MDRLIGGVGMSMASTRRSTLQPGDGVDFSRVQEIAHGERISLRAEMKLPGRAWREFALIAESETARCRCYAWFEPGDWPVSCTGRSLYPSTC